MTFEQQLTGALQAADEFEPSADLFAKVQRSIEEDAQHRGRVKRLVNWVLGAVAFVAVYLTATVRVESGEWSMSFLALELLVSMVMVAVVVVLGPAIRRFGESFERGVFGSSAATGRRILDLLDVAYYLIFGSFVLFTMVFTPPTDMGSLTLADWIDYEVSFRLGGLLMLMGVLHVGLVVVLPLVGLVHRSNRRRERVALGTPSTDPALDRVDGAITVVSWVMAIAITAFLVLVVLLGVLGAGA